MKPALLTLAVAAVLAAPAVASTPRGPAVAATPDERLPPGACIRPADIVSQRIGRDKQSVYLLVNGRGTYRLEMQGACLRGAHQSDRVIFHHPPGYERACKPSDLIATVVKNGGSRPCSVQSVTLLTHAEARALPKNLRP